MGSGSMRRPWLVSTLSGVGPGVSSARLAFITAPVEGRKPKPHAQAANGLIGKDFKAGNNQTPCLPCSAKYFVKY